MARPQDASLDPTLTAASALAGGRMRLLVAAFLVVVIAISAQVAVHLPGTPVPVTLYVRPGCAPVPARGVVQVGPAARVLLGVPPLARGRERGGGLIRREG